MTLFQMNNDVLCLVKKKNQIKRKGFMQTKTMETEIAVKIFDLLPIVFF